MNLISKFVAVLALSGAALFAQQFRTSSQDPSGGCTTDVVFNQLTGTMWGCKAGVFTNVGINGTSSGIAGITIAAAKTLTVSNSLTLAGTDSTTMTFPTTSATIARTDAANTFTGVQTLSSAPVLSTSTLTSGAGTITFPTASITVPGTILTDCGSSASCASPTTRSSTMKAVTGTIAFSSSTTAAVSAISPAFTGATSYVCTVDDPSHVYTWSIGSKSGSGFTITAGTSNSDTWAYTCVGY